MQAFRCFGINLGGELTKSGDEKLYEAKETIINAESNIEITSTAIYELLTKENKLEIRSSLLKNASHTLEFKSVIKKISANTENCWILVENGEVFSFNFITKQQKRIAESFTDISSTNQYVYGISCNNLYKITEDSHEKIHEFVKHQKIKKILSGAEHTLIMTTNGDVFSFGCGLRGALGHGDVNNHEKPQQIEALAGLKIVDISAGSFHSAAVSSFGDVYTWGWNTNGQLGLPKVAQHTFEKASESHQQVYTTPQLIDIEDENESLTNVFCGSRHTILKTERNRLFAAGLNNYGQLGLSSHVEDIGKFTEMPVKNLTEKTKISCGFWSTFLIDRIE